MRRARWKANVGENIPFLNSPQTEQKTLSAPKACYIFYYITW